MGWRFAIQVDRACRWAKTAEESAGSALRQVSRDVALRGGRLTRAIAPMGLALVAIRCVAATANREGQPRGRRASHRCWGKRAAFPFAMHMLSTGIHPHKWRSVLALAGFPVFHLDFHARVRFIFPLFARLRSS